MFRVALLVLIAVTAPQAAAARVKVIGEIPKDYWGEWTSGLEPCKSGDTEVLVLSAKAYEGPLGKCDVVSVSEIPGQNGAIYSARMLCSGLSQTEKKTLPGDLKELAAGSTFDSLSEYQRCSEKTPASK